MENNEMNLTPAEEQENKAPQVAVPTPPEAYETVAAEVSAEPKVQVPYVAPQPVNTPAQAPVVAKPYVPAVHAISPVNPDVQVKKSGKGLTVFILLVVFVLLLTVATGAGFILGREYDNLRDQALGKVPVVGLEAKPADGTEFTVESIYSTVSKSVVRIAVYSGESSSYSYASGVIYSEDGYIVTNDHIYESLPDPQFIIQTWDGKMYDGVFVAGDTRSDLAVLKIDAKDLTPATFGNSDEIIIGEDVVAIGNPDGAEKSVATTGIVSANNIWVSGNTNYSTRLIQTDAALNPGSSGGALVNAYGQVIGITSSKIIADDTDLVNYAIPTTVMKRVVDSLIKNGYVTGRSVLGITYSELGMVEAEMMGYPCGLYIQSISEDSGLYGKGLNKGDIITHVNGVEITSASVMLLTLENTEAGTTITVTVETESGQVVDVNAKLKEYIGGSSYLEKGQGAGGNGEFDFPMGE